MRTCLVGLGRIAVQLERDPLRAKPCTHAGSLLHFHKTAARKTGFALVGVCDHNQEKIDEFQQWWRSAGREKEKKAPAKPARAKSANTNRKSATDAAEVPAYVDYRQLLRETRPDFVIIATRTDSHFAIARDAMRQGVRGILLEKPISLNLNDARKLERLARETETRVWVNFERRYHPAYRLVKEYVEQETLGPLRGIQGQVLTWPLRAGANTASADIAGPLLHDAIHWLDLLIWYAGKPPAVHARLLESAAVPAVEDTAFVHFDYPEFQARLESGGRRNYFEFTIQLDFEHGRIRSGNEGHFWFRSLPSKRYKNFRDLQPFTPKIPARPGYSNGNAWLNLYAEILDEMTTAKPVSYDRIADAVAGINIVHECTKKLGRGKARRL